MAFRNIGTSLELISWELLTIRESLSYGITNVISSKENGTLRTFPVAVRVILIPLATPRFSAGTEPIIELELGETNSAIPKPNKNSYPPFAVFPTKGNKVFNSVLDIRRKLHLYTTSPKSKCYLAAGWFALKQTNEYSTILCPKYIFVQRYDYKGPFMTEEEAIASINTK